VRATRVPSTGGEPVHYFHMFFRMANGSYIDRRHDGDPQPCDSLGW
jgi:hypothetical protein